MGALPQLDRAVSLCQNTDLPGWLPLVAPAWGVAHALAGHVAEVVPLLTQAMEQVTAVGSVDLQARCGLSLGEA